VALPSVLVDELWQELVRHAGEYAEFCDAAFGRVLHRTSESATTGVTTTADQGRLRRTPVLARQDEGCGRRGIPLLFRVDRQLGVDSGRSYVADCGGHGECYEVAGTVCLQHLTGVGAPTKPGPPNRGAGRKRVRLPCHGGDARFVAAIRWLLIPDGRR
jgi:hypothetical protein